jgi:hypothetical protein
MTEIEERRKHMVEQKGTSLSLFALLLTAVALLLMGPLTVALAQTPPCYINGAIDSDCDRLTDVEDVPGFTFPDQTTTIPAGPDELNPNYRDVIVILFRVDPPSKSYIPIKDSQCDGYTGNAANLCSYDAFEHLTGIGMKKHVYDDYWPPSIANLDRTITNRDSGVGVASEALAAFLHEDLSDDGITKTLGKTNQTILLDNGSIYPTRIKRFVVQDVYQNEAGDTSFNADDPSSWPDYVKNAIIGLTKEVAAHEIGHALGCMPVNDPYLGHHLREGAGKIMEAFPYYRVNSKRGSVEWRLSTVFSKTCRNGASLY